MKILVHGEPLSQKFEMKFESIDIPNDSAYRDRAKFIVITPNSKK